MMASSIALPISDLGIPGPRIKQRDLVASDFIRAGILTRTVTGPDFGSVGNEKQLTKLQLSGCFGTACPTFGIGELFRLSSIVSASTTLAPSARSCFSTPTMLKNRVKWSMRIPAGRVGHGHSISSTVEGLSSARE